MLTQELFVIHDCSHVHRYMHTCCLNMCKCSSSKKNMCTTLHMCQLATLLQFFLLTVSPTIPCSMGSHRNMFSLPGMNQLFCTAEVGTQSDLSPHGCEQEVLTLGLGSAPWRCSGSVSLAAGAALSVAEEPRVSPLFKIGSPFPYSFWCSLPGGTGPFSDRCLSVAPS